nr:transposase [Pseudomonas fulva]
MTKRLAEAVIQACERLPTPHVAEMFGLHWDSVRLLERRALQAALEKLPKAHVVYNLFDAVAKYGREVIDRVRVDKTNRLRHHKPARKVIKQARWLLLCNAENLKREDQQVRLQDLLAPNQSLMTVYLMKAELKALWSPATALGLAVSLEALHLADESAMPALKQFAKRLKGCWRGTKQGEMA